MALYTTHVNRHSLPRVHKEAFIESTRHDKTDGSDPSRAQVKRSDMRNWVSALVFPGPVCPFPFPAVHAPLTRVRLPTYGYPSAKITDGSHVTRRV